MENDLSISRLHEKIETIWKTKIQDDFLNYKFGYHENTLVGAFYYHIRPLIDKYPNLRIYMEHFDRDLKYRYDLVIMKRRSKYTRKSENYWLRNWGHYWIVMEFKYHPRLDDRSAQYDIKKFQALKKYDEFVKRVYFFSIDKNDYFIRYITYRGKWYKDFYWEGRGVLNDDKWKFSLLKPKS